MSSKIDKLPKAFIWRRLHSLTGLWFVLFLIEHLITNSQAALLLGDSGKGFVHMVNVIHDLPYLTVIEIGLLAVPIGIHVIWGIKYALTSKPNSASGGNKKPHLKYRANKAYTWQRITSWILLVLLAVHVAKFRFIEYPTSVNTGTSAPAYLVICPMDPGLYTVAGRLDVKLYDQKQQNAMRAELAEEPHPLAPSAKEIRERGGTEYDEREGEILRAAQRHEEREAYLKAVTGLHLKEGEVVASSPSFGIASLLNVRSTFQNPIWVGVYTVFVVCACFHAFNGLWTSMLTWGWVVRVTAQKMAKRFTISLMVILTILGLIAVWGTYFWNLKH